MREVYIDTSFVDNKSGIGRESRFFVQEVLNLFPNSLKVNYRSGILKKMYFIFLVFFRISKFKFKSRSHAKQGYLFMSHLQLIKPTGFIKVIRIHDVFPITNKEWFRRASVLIYRFAFASLTRHDLILADSNFTRKAILELNPDLNVHVLPCKYPRVQDFNCTGCESCEVTDFPENYFLCVNTIEPRKNYKFLLAVWEEFVSTNDDYYLVIVGRNGWKSNALIRKMIRTKNVVWLKNACDKTLALGYSKASLVINPSLSEGFNYPTIEASLFSTKVIASRIECNLELHQGIIMFDPIDKIELLEIMQKALNPDFRSVRSDFLDEYQLRLFRIFQSQGILET
jgi:glycosyltransferase involved in cell wall biosynthesis